MSDNYLSVRSVTPKTTSSFNPSDKKDTPTYISIAFKTKGGVSFCSWARFRLAVVGFKYMHSELIIPERCTAFSSTDYSSCVRCTQLKSKQRGEDVCPYGKIHLIAWTSTINDDIHYQIDRAFDENYEFLTVCVSNISKIKKFLNEQLVSTYQVPTYKTRSWLCQRFCCSGIFCACCYQPIKPSYQKTWYCSELISSALNVDLDETDSLINGDTPDCLYHSVVGRHGYKSMLYPSSDFPTIKRYNRSDITKPTAKVVVNAADKKASSSLSESKKSNNQAYAPPTPPPPPPTTKISKINGNIKIELPHKNCSKL